MVGPRRTARRFFKNRLAYTLSRSRKPTHSSAPQDIHQTLFKQSRSKNNPLILNDFRI
jgi:hypothetical protein